MEQMASLMMALTLPRQAFSTKSSALAPLQAPFDQEQLEHTSVLTKPLHGHAQEFPPMQPAPLQSSPPGAHLMPPSHSTVQSPQLANRTSATVSPGGQAIFTCPHPSSCCAIGKGV